MERPLSPFMSPTWYRLQITSLAAITARGFIAMDGALPVVVDCEVIGAIGASFATPEQDQQVAKPGLAGLNE